MLTISGRRWVAGLGLLLLASMLAGCLNVDRTKRARTIAAPVGLVGQLLEAGPFDLMTRHRFGRPGDPITLYIEGDGLAWISRYRRSDNPTPTDPVALKMAAQDPAINLGYIARPCQFVDLKRQPQCTPRYWDEDRFSEEVVEAVNRAVTQLKEMAQASHVHLVGFSGGGAVAALVAARRDDVGSLRTVAGNLDHKAFTRHHEVSGMTGSLNPIDVADRLGGIPYQIHFNGMRDKVVPQFIAERFMERLGKPACVTGVRVPGAAHIEGWSEKWSRLLWRRPDCYSAPVGKKTDLERGRGQYPEALKKERSWFSSDF